MCAQIWEPRASITYRDLSSLPTRFYDLYRSISFQLIFLYLPPALLYVLKIPIYHMAHIVDSQAFSLKNLDALVELWLDVRNHHLSPQHTLIGRLKLGAQYLVALQSPWRVIVSALQKLADPLMSKHSCISKMTCILAPFCLCRCWVSSIMGICIRTWICAPKHWWKWRWGEKREEACALERTPCLSPELPLPTVENRELACVT